MKLGGEAPGLKSYIYICNDMMVSILFDNSLGVENYLQLKGLEWVGEREWNENRKCEA